MTCASMPDLTPAQLVVSVEHASPRVPAALQGLGLTNGFLDTHFSWDPGAAAVGRFVARACGAPLHLGRWSRLVADLNRTANHRQVIAPRAGGRRRTGRRSRPTWTGWWRATVRSCT
jgi:predicted N-formylglutamate amidohydrolase